MSYARIIIGVLFFIWPAFAYAHPGTHAHLSTHAIISHFLSQPDHAALMLLALMIVSFAAARIWSRLCQQRR